MIKSTDNAIRVSHLVKRFGSLVAVNDASFEVGQGEIFAFLGPNGAGKTTTIKMLTTLLKPTSGQISVNGFDPLLNQDEVRKSFGIVFQDSSLDEELTALENMEFHGVLYGVPTEARRTRTRNLLEMVGLWDRRKGLVKTFSGGMRRRLEIARGLLHHPKIFFLDEPTLGLDPQTRSKIWDHIKQLNESERTTVFFTTHYMEEAEQMAQKVAIIDRGRIIAQGTPAEIKAQTAVSSLEEAFLALTGKVIREEKVTNLDRMRMFRNMRTAKR